MGPRSETAILCPSSIDTGKRGALVDSGKIGEDGNLTHGANDTN
jgi:hypothetical protein